MAEQEVKNPDETMEEAVETAEETMDMQNEAGEAEETADATEATEAEAAEGTKEGKGLFPTSAVFSTDLHSLGQYIQEGERIMFETVVTFAKPKKEIYIKEDPENVDGLNFLTGKTMTFINEKAYQGTVLAHNDGGVPNIIIKNEDMTEKSLGYLIYFFEKACAISGYVLGINPFDQPGVESYKKNMFALLGKPGYENEKEVLEERLNK